MNNQQVQKAVELVDDLIEAAEKQWEILTDLYADLKELNKILEDGLKAIEQGVSHDRK